MDGILFNEPLKGVIRDLSDVATTLWDRGWAERNAGNLSMDITDVVETAGIETGGISTQEEAVAQLELKGRTFLVTATGTRFRELPRRPERNLLMVRIQDGLDGYHVLWGGEGIEKRATSEFPSHLAIHGFLRRNRCPQKAVLHTHPTALIALTHMERFRSEDDLNRLLWAMHPELKVFLPEGVGFAPYRRPGSRALAEVTLEALKEHRVILWEKHGCVAIGNDMPEAFDLIDTVNKSADIFFLCRSAGVEPEGLSEEQIEELKEYFGASA